MSEAMGSARGALFRPPVQAAGREAVGSQGRLVVGEGDALPRKVVSQGTTHLVGQSPSRTHQSGSQGLSAKKDSTTETRRETYPFLFFPRGSVALLLKAWSLGQQHHWSLLETCSHLRPTASDARPPRMPTHIQVLS